MEKTFTTDKQLLEYMKDVIEASKEAPEKLENAKFHHNTCYKMVPSILEHGILSLKKQTETKVANFSEADILRYSDTTSHINGSDGISLAVVGLKDLYEKEDEYNPASIYKADLIIDSSVKAYRSTEHYGNEYIAYDEIKPECLRAIDIRLLKHIDLLLKKGVTSDDVLEQLVERYHALKTIAHQLILTKSSVIVREASYDSEIKLNLEKVMRFPNIKR